MMDMVGGEGGLERMGLRRLCIVVWSIWGGGHDT